MDAPFCEHSTCQCSRIRADFRPFIVLNKTVSRRTIVGSLGAAAALSTFNPASLRTQPLAEVASESLADFRGSRRLRVGQSQSGRQSARRTLFPQKDTHSGQKLLVHHSGDIHQIGAPLACPSSKQTIILSLFLHTFEYFDHTVSIEAKRRIFGFLIGSCGRTLALRSPRWYRQ
jgi:hypothetical protein